MMAACRLSESDYTLTFVQADGKLSWAAMSAANPPKHILLLGVNPRQLAIQALFKLNTMNDFMGYTFIPSLSLSQIEDSPEQKKDLWLQGLKPALGL
jgi:hypothetical protein